jgi:hypothetical protein
MIEAIVQNVPIISESHALPPTIHPPSHCPPVPGAQRIKLSDIECVPWYGQPVMYGKLQTS